MYVVLAIFMEKKHHKVCVNMWKERWTCLWRHDRGNGNKTEERLYEGDE